jgi:hypothetical protein
MNELKQAIRELSLEPGTSYENLTVYPIHGTNGHQPTYLTLDVALEKNLIQVKEVSDAGSVPTLKVTNRADQPVLFLDGEELIGSKQNRVLNISVLVPASSELVIPVSCVEAGRWAYHSRAFKSSSDAQYAEGRAMKAASVSGALSRLGVAQSNQGQVWSGIEQKMGKMRARSSSSAMAAIFDQHRTRVEDYVKAFTAQPHQIGAVFAIGSKVKGIEFFDTASTYSRLSPKILRSYAIDALELTGHQTVAPHAREAQGLLNRLVETEYQSYPAVGLGDDVRISGEELVGGGLVFEEKAVHFMGFVM